MRLHILESPVSDQASIRSFLNLISRIMWLFGMVNVWLFMKCHLI